MKKNAKILYITSAAAVVLGLLLFTAGWMLGGRPSFAIGSDGIRTLSDSDGIRIRTVAIDDCERISIDMGDADIYVEASDSDTFYMEYRLSNDQKEPSCEVKDGVLHVTGSSLSDTKGFLFAPVSMEERFYVKLYIPEEYNFSKIRLNTESGCIIWDMDAYADTAEIGNSCGDTTLDGLSCSSIEMTSDSGNIKVADADIGNAAIQNDYGDVTLEDLTVDGTLSVAMDNGKLTLDTVNAASASLNSEYGDITGKLLSGKDLNVTLSDGDCTLKSVDYTNIRGESGYGNVTLALTAPRDNYTFTLKTEYGKIRLDDKTSENALISSGSGQNTVTITADDGDITVETAEGKKDR